MENENMEKIILTDEELKEVAGGAIQSGLVDCQSIKKMEDCGKLRYCRWILTKCVSKITGY